MTLARFASAALVVSATYSAASCGKTIELDGGSDAADAATDANPHCTGSFTASTPLTEVNTTANEAGFRLTPDELTAVFSRITGPDATAVGPPDVFVATRASVTAPFGSFIAAWPFVPSNMYERPLSYPSLTADSLSVYVESAAWCEDPILTYSSPLCVMRTDGGGTFAGFYPAFEPDDGIALRVRLTLHGFVTPDAGAYYFVRPVDLDAAADTTVNGIYVSMSAPYNVFTTDTLALSSSDSTVQLDNPVLSADELTIFVGVTGLGARPHIQVSTRAALGEAFGPLTPVHELDSAEGEYPTWTSTDQCRLYLTRTVGGQTDIFVASRSR